MVKKDDEESVSSEAKGPLKSFQALMGEGEKFSRDKLYTKAIQCYSEALGLLPQDDDKSSPKDINDRLNGLVARSACHLKIGKNDLALQDAEESLKSNKEFTKGLYQKAEALYAMGEFELALMFYHRGKKLRSDLREFQLGINKAQEAIDNSVGDPNRVKLEASGDLSIFYKNEEDEAKKKKKQPMGYVRASQKKETAVQRKYHVPPPNPKTTKQLLGELYEDRSFLEKIINNTVVTKSNTKSGDAIYQLASDGLDYLDSRTSFWRQQEPLYARAKFSRKPEGDDETYKHIRRELEAIDEQQNMDQFVDARRRAHRLLDFCERLDEKKFTEKQSVLADVYSRLGNAYLELGDYNKALEYHNRDLRIAETKHFDERKSRALDNLGRVYARSGQFPQAIQVWERKIPLATLPLEKAWLFHEIGQCHFGLGDYERAKRYGERSYAEAVDVKDPIWQLNAKVLVAHSETKLRQYRDAERTFDEALVLAKDQHDVAAERAIERAAKEVRDQIAKGAADSPPDRNETNYEIKVKSKDQIVYDHADHSDIKLTIFGDNGSSGPIDLRSDEHDSKKFNGQSVTLKKKAYDAGKLTKIALTCKHVESWPLESIEVSDTKRKSKHKFFLPQPLDSNTTIADLYPEGSIVPLDFGMTGKDDKKGKHSAQRSPSTMKQSDTAPSSARTSDTQKKADEQKAKAKEEADLAAKKAQAAASNQATTQPSSSSQKSVQYTVTTQTGSKLSSGTDANVYVSLFGDKNKVVRRPLKKSTSGRNPFEKDHKDDFEFDDEDIGKLNTITIEHDGTGLGSGWYLEYVEVKVHDQTVKFPVERWLDINEGDKRISLELEPNKKPVSKGSEDDSKAAGAIPYEIIVKTGEKLGAGTDANVFLSVFGDKDKFERRHLKEGHDIPPSLAESLQQPKSTTGAFRQTRNVVETLTGKKNLFESAGTDYFRLSEPDVGKIKTVRIEHDGSGIGAGWYLESIEIRHPTQNQIYKFPVDRWLDAGEGDKRISLDLEPDKKPGQLTKYDTLEEEEKRAKAEAEKQAKAARMTPTGLYTVTIQTGTKVGAGTDANVFISLVGDKNKVIRRPLKKPADGRDPFENDQKDRFVFDDEDVGKLQTITIEHDGAGIGAGWYLDWVEVKVRDQVYTFPVDRWLDAGEGDERISLDLEPNKKPGQIKTAKMIEAEEKRAKAEADKHAKEEAEKREKAEKEAKHKAEEEAKAKAEQEKKAEAEAEKHAKEEAEKREKAETEAKHKADEEARRKAGLYTVTTQTGSKLGAGTDATVYISLFGDKSKVLRRPLKKPLNGGNAFEKEQKDDFVFDDEDVGKLQKIIIEHDGTGVGAGWYLDWVEVRVRDDITRFPVDRWLDVGEGDERISLELEPNKQPGQLKTYNMVETDEKRAKTGAEKHAKEELQKRTKAEKEAHQKAASQKTTASEPTGLYTVTTQTGAKIGSGTDANVYISLFGDKKKVVRRPLKKPVDNWNPFEKDQKDRFVFDDEDVGKLKTITIEHDGAGVGSGWYLDWVEVRVRDDIIRFPVDRWLDVGEGDERISLELEPNKKPGQLKIYRDEKEGRVTAAEQSRAKSEKGKK